jgi:hypothetical protein
LNIPYDRHGLFSWHHMMIYSATGQLKKDVAPAIVDHDMTVHKFFIRVPACLLPFRFVVKQKYCYHRTPRHMGIASLPNFLCQLRHIPFDPLSNMVAQGELIPFQSHHFLCSLRN